MKYLLTYEQYLTELNPFQITDPKTIGTQKPIKVLMDEVEDSEKDDEKKDEDMEDDDTEEKQGNENN